MRESRTDREKGERVGEMEGEGGEMGKEKESDRQRDSKKEKRRDKHGLIERDNSWSDKSTRTGTQRHIKIQCKKRSSTDETKQRKERHARVCFLH